ncbi:MAG: hypothetical protein QXE79_06475 [Candidatus Bathyarchaeia archaeon]
MVRVFGRRAVSGAITGMFVVLIFVAAISALLAYNTSQDRYNQAVNERNQMEWERLNEKIIIPSAERIEEDGTLNATVQNIGVVTAHLVSLWLSAYDGNGEPQWQQQYSIDIWISPGETKHNFGRSSTTYTLVKPDQYGEILPSIYLPNVSWTYVIKIITERGNMATYILQPPKEEEEREGYPIPVAYSFGSMRVTREDIPGYEWRPPNVTYADVYSDNLYIRVIVRNLLDEYIFLTDDSGFTCTVTGAKNPSQDYYIIGGLVDPQLHNWEGDLVLAPGEESYIYFKVSINSLVPYSNNPIQHYTFAGIAAFTGTKSGKFWSGSLLMDAIYYTSYPKK